MYANRVNQKLTSGNFTYVNDCVPVIFPHNFLTLHGNGNRTQERRHQTYTTSAEVSARVSSSIFDVMGKLDEEFVLFQTHRFRGI